MLLRIDVDSKLANEDGYNDENDKIYQKLVKQAEEMNLSTKGDIPQLKKRIREYRRKQRTK